MRYLLLTFGLLVSFSTFAQNETEYKEYSYTQFFQMIEDEKDTVFRMQDAIIRYDAKTDSAFKAPLTLDQDSVLNRPKRLTVNKKLELNNVQFYANTQNLNSNNGIFYGALVDIDFRKDVILNDVAALNIYNCQFRGEFFYNFTNSKLDADLILDASILTIAHSTFNRFIMAKNSGSLNNYNINPNIKYNEFKSTKPTGTSFALTISGFYASTFKGNRIESQGRVLYFHDSGKSGIRFSNNTIISNNINWNHRSIGGKVELKNTKFSSQVQLGIDLLNKQDEIEWETFKGKLISESSFIDYLYSGESFDNSSPSRRDSVLQVYCDSVRYYNSNAFSNEIALMGMFYEHYKSKYITETANEVYLDLKDFETHRLEVLYEQNKTFDSFFKWKINQFLKVFAAYGTEPARAITMSVYVVLCFAIVYLFYPNYWDSHGKNRIKHRFLFFHKYLRQNKGIQDVYLEGQTEEIESSHAFRKVLDEHKDEVPSFFYRAAGPLLKWSTAGTTIYSNLLRRVDFLKGSWKDTDPKIRGLKTALTIMVFVIALFYDLFIKVLNALMLSINTFTTLGFGEIPIKGLPRYLAIIQGFIGWFMLTIFSVSLISQLLN